MSRTDFIRLWKCLVGVLPHLLVASVLVFALTATYLRSALLPWPWLDMARTEIRGACEHPDAQWMTVALVALYLFSFAGLRWLQVGSLLNRVRIRTRLVLMLMFAGWAIVSYTLNYRTAAGSTDLLVLLTALAVGQGVAFFLEREESTGRSRADLKSNLFRLIAVLLALASLVHPAASREFQDRGQTRWVGLWENPNNFGALMAMGIVLATGLLIASLAACWGKTRSTTAFRIRFLPQLSAAVWLACFASCATGLLFSYSRGAWLGAALGLGLLGWRSLCSVTEPSSPPRLRLLLFRRCAPALVLLALSLGVIAFWSLRHTEIPLLRRVFTVGNINDFSWRNRVATWPGALQVIARKPIAGWGWNRPVAVFDHGHQPAWLSESAAITLNDYFMIGMTLGVPTLLAFLLWIRLVWQPADFPSSPASLPHAALLPLLLSFGFDGGLFNLALAVPFSVMLELGIKVPPGS